MTCDCKKSIESMLMERFKESAPCATDHAVTLEGYTLVLGEKLTQKGCMPIHCTAKHPLKRGGVKEKTEKQNMIFTYCPFCGIKYEAEVTSV